MAKKSAGPNANDAGNLEPGNDGDTGGNPSINTGAELVGGLPVTDPASVGTGTEPGSAGDKPKRGRGRPAGSGSKPRAPKTVAASEASVKGLEKILVSVHAMMAGFTGAAELNIDAEEAGQMSSAIAEVAKHYSVTADPKTMAWVNLAAACGMVYGPRVGAIKLRRALKRPPAKVEPTKAAPPGPTVVEGRFPLATGNAPLPEGGLTLPTAVTLN